MSTTGSQHQPGQQDQPVQAQPMPGPDPSGQAVQDQSGQAWGAGPFGDSRPVKKPGLWSRFRARTFSDLNLNGHTPPRVQPEVGEWGPEKVPTTKQKKRMRIYVSIALPVVMLACFLLGWYVYYLMTGCYGFGLGCRGQG